MAPTAMTKRQLEGAALEPQWSKKHLSGGDICADEKEQILPRSMHRACQEAGKACRKGLWQEWLWNAQRAETRVVKLQLADQGAGGKRDGGIGMQETEHTQRVPETKMSVL